MTNVLTPIPWARYGRISQLIARLLPTRPPAVLVLSLGRSGSTWLGSTLGQAADALYLHEPLTQSLLATGGQETNFEIDPANPPRPYRDWAAAAFAGLPALPAPAKSPTRIVRFAEQWRLSERRRRRLVIKEVNPFACAWLVQRYRPKVIYLVRHPAAVALSNGRLGFLNGQNIWQRQGEHQGRAHRHVLNALSAGGYDYRVMVYEELCTDPLGHFRSLFSFAGLHWDEAAEQRVQANSAGGDKDNPWSVARNSEAMIHSWRAEIESHDLLALQQAFAGYNLPWYTQAEDWQVKP